MLNYHVWTLMEGKTPPRDIKDIKQYYTRWAIQRDQPQIIELAKRHPDFSNFEDSGSIEQVLNSMSSQPDMIGMVVEDDNGKIVGFMLYKLNPKYLETPLIVADDADVAYALIKKVKDKITPNGQRNMLYIRSHLNDPSVLQAMKDHGMVTNVNDDEIHAKYPMANIQHPNIYSTYHSLLQGQQPPSDIRGYSDDEEEEAGDDPWGIFKDLPWKK